MDQTRSTGTNNNNHSSAERGNIDNTHAKNATQTAALNHGAVEQPGQQESMFRLSNDKDKHWQTQCLTKQFRTTPSTRAPRVCFYVHVHLKTEITRCRQETAECGLPRRLSNAVRTDAKCEIVNQSPRTLNLKKTSTTSTNVLRKHNQTNKLTSANTNGQPVEPECVSRRCDNRNAACFAKC